MPDKAVLAGGSDVLSATLLALLTLSQVPVEEPVSVLADAGEVSVEDAGVVVIEDAGVVDLPLAPRRPAGDRAAGDTTEAARP